MVVMPSYGDQILPLARLGAELRPDYLVLKHCSDNEDGDLGVNYQDYEKIYDTLRAAEALSTESYQVVVKWSKIEAQGGRSYQRCYGAPFMLQISGSGLVAPCGMLFNERYKKFHIGNICEQRIQGHLVERSLLGGHELPGLAPLQRPEDVRLALPAAQGQRDPGRLPKGLHPASPPGGPPSAAPRLHLTAACARAGAQGRCTWNAVPFPSALSNVSRPPC